jgi:hypothetical protein
MLDFCSLIFGMVIDLLRSRAELEAEILVLRQQINVLRRANSKSLPFNSIDRLRRGVSTVSQDVRCNCNRPTGHCDPLAPCRFQIVLALEIATSLRATDRVFGSSSANPRDEHRQPVVGSAETPW